MSIEINTIINLKKKPELIQIAVSWFHSKWNVPEKEYLGSMASALESVGGVPRWYIVTNDKNEIIAGLGVIENDFHKRPDLTPNLCALFVEEKYRKLGIAKALLDNACEQLSQAEINTAYLLTTHIDFYERCGWTFYGMVEEDDGNMIRMYQHKN